MRYSNLIIFSLLFGFSLSSFVLPTNARAIESNEIPEHSGKKVQDNSVSTGQAKISNNSRERNRSINVELSKAQQKDEITSCVKRFYSQGVVAENYSIYMADWEATVDETGEVRVFSFDRTLLDKTKKDPSYRAFAERSRDAVLHPKCSISPLPKNMLGKGITIKFRFRP